MEVEQFSLTIIKSRLDNILVMFSEGLLVAACINRAPEGTFGAAAADVGVLDYLKVSFILQAHHGTEIFGIQFADFTIG